MMDKVSRPKSPVHKTLRELYAEHGGKVAYKWSSYLEVYERLFAPFRDKPVRLLEIGVLNGGSLEIWQKYFPRAEIIVGCDINPDCRKLGFDDKKIAVIIGDANSQETEREITACSAEYDIVIDDGSHKSSDIVRSFARYFRLLADGGIYVAEDLHCSYWNAFEGGLYEPYSSMSFFKRMLDVVNREHWGIPRERADVLAAFAKKYSTAFDEASLRSIHSVEFVNSLCILRKAPQGEKQLGQRKLAGQTAIVHDGFLPLEGTTSTPPDETNNPWSLHTATMEEETETNRAKVTLQEQTIETLTRDLAGARAEIGVCEQELAELDRELSLSRGQARAAEEALAATKEEVTEHGREITRSRKEAQRLQSVIGEIHQSHSWRITKPLRAVRRFMARLR